MKKQKTPNFYCPKHPTESLKDVRPSSNGFCASCNSNVQGTTLLTLQTKSHQEFAAMDEARQKEYLEIGGQVVD